jgi:hypothetical protein
VGSEESPAEMCIRVWGSAPGGVRAASQASSRLRPDTVRLGPDTVRLGAGSRRGHRAQDRPAPPGDRQDPARPRGHPGPEPLRPPRPLEEVAGSPLPSLPKVRPPGNVGGLRPVRRRLPGGRREAQERPPAPRLPRRELPTRRAVRRNPAPGRRVASPRPEDCSHGSPARPDRADLVLLAGFEAFVSSLRRLGANEGGFSGDFQAPDRRSGGEQARIGGRARRLPKTWVEPYSGTPVRRPLSLTLRLDRVGRGLPCLYGPPNG